LTTVVEVEQPAGQRVECLYGYTIRPVVQPVVQPVRQPAVSCKRGSKGPNEVDLDGACSDEGEQHGDHVDGQLKLEELGDAVVDVTTPHDRLDDAREVVVGQHNIGRLLRHVRPRDTLSKHRRENVFTARRHASAVGLYAVVVRLSVHPSQVGVLLKPLKEGSREQRHTSPWTLVFYCQRSRQMQTQSPQRRRQMQVV